MRGLTFIRDERVLWRRVVDGVLLCPPHEEEILAVNGSGARLWELLAMPQTAATAGLALSVDFGREPSELAAELEAALNDLAAQELIRRVIGTAGSGDSG